MVFRLLTIVVLFFSFNLYAESVESLTAEGTARTEWDEPGGREAATKEAYKDAIRKTLIIMSNEQAVRANELKLAPLYDDAKKYILESQQIMEKQDSTLKTISIKLNINVDKDAIQGFLSEKGISLTSERNLMILPLIIEKTEGNSGDFWWKENISGSAKKGFSDVEKALSIYFSQSNYALIDPYQNSLSAQVPQSYRYMELKVPELIELGKTFGVGLIANGYVQTECKKEENSCSTVVSLQMVSTDTGKVIAAKRAVEVGTAKNIEEAKIVSRAKACQTVASSVLSQMTTKWAKKSASSYKLVFKGVKDYPTYSKLRACLASGIIGLNNITERYMTKGTFVFDAEKRGVATSIGPNVISKCYTDGSGSVGDQSDNFVEIKVQ